MELFRVEIPKYIREVVISEKQRPVYYEWDGISIRGKGKYVLQKYLNRNVNPRKARPTDIKQPYEILQIFRGSIYEGYIDYKLKAKKPVHIDIYNKEVKQILYNLDNMKPVIANMTKAGTPRILQIKGQDIYSGNIGEHTRAKVMYEIKNSFIPFLKDLSPVKKYPIRITMELHDTVNNIYSKGDQRWDVDNRAYPYCKAFPDVLTQLGIIEDDDRCRVTQPPVPLFCPIDNEQNRKLVFIIEHDTRDIVSKLIQVNSYFLTGKPPIISFNKNKELTKVKLIKNNNHENNNN